MEEVLILLNSSGLPVEGFCFHNSVENDFSQTVQLFLDAGLSTKQVRAPDFDFRDECAQMSRHRAILTVRFLAAIVAGIAGVPVLAVANGQYYRSKMIAAGQGCPATQVIDISTSSPTKTVQVLQQGAFADTND